MKKLVGIYGICLCVGSLACNVLHTESPRKPDIFMRLGQADQVCAGQDKTAQIDVFVSLRNLPPQDVRFVLDQKKEVWLRGDTLSLHFYNVPLGPHRVDVYVAYRPDPWTKLFSVWDCS